MIVLGIETSCDETAAAVVTGERRVLSDIVLSQIADHAPYGGVVPEIAARSHVEHLDGLIARAMEEAEVGFAELDGVAATAGPGLIGAVMVGLMTGKAIAAVHDKPLLAVNHLEGHALSPRLIAADLDFPYLLLLVSGGHCQLLLVEEVDRYRRLGTTIDDAVGEAFDKAAMLLELDYPGGPAIERAAKDGDPVRVSPASAPARTAGMRLLVFGAQDGAAPRRSSDGHRHRRATAPTLRRRSKPRSPTCSSTARRTRSPCSATQDVEPTALVVAGGVAANSEIRRRIERAGGGSWPRPQHPAAPALHRQCGDDRLGRHRAPKRVASPTRSTHRRARAGPSTKDAGLAEGAGVPGRLGRKA